MTLDNCKRLLAHYKKIGNKEGAAEMKARIEKKEPVKEQIKENYDGKKRN